ncbi:hypothetical protein BH11GEM1_BH11GEM1_33530 [soil metagenome]
MLEQFVSCIAAVAVPPIVSDNQRRTIAPADCRPPAPNGLPTWGDGGMTILGTDGFIELGKYVDIGGSTLGDDHRFLVDQKGVQKIACEGVERRVDGN